MKVFKPVLLAGLALATSANALTFVPFHSSVNLSVAPSGADRSRMPIATQQAENARRVAVAVENGFDFVRLRVAMAPWIDTGSVADQQEALILANGIIQQVLAKGQRIDVVMMAGSPSTTTSPGLICTAAPSAMAACTAGWHAVLALLPDTFHVRSSPSMSRRIAPQETRCGTRSGERSSSLSTAITRATTRGQTSPHSTQPLTLGARMSCSRSTTTTLHVYGAGPPLAARWAL
jgi:hypothetical protein